MPKNKEDNLIWVDLEMTGLEPETDTILEIALVITDSDLNILGEDKTYYIHHEQEKFEGMNDWCKDQHTKSGLWDKVVESKTTIEEAEGSILEFLKPYTESRKNVLCGNSIHQDRRFINKYMKKLDEYLHYRMIDVSTIKELAKRWYPEIKEEFSKKGSHRAYDDIIESIEELKFQKKLYFK